MPSFSRLILALCATVSAVCAAEDWENVMDATKYVADETIIDTKGLNATSNGWTMYKQCDSQWSGQQLGTCSGTTICSAGCAMTSVAMILQTKGANKNPSTLNSWLKSNGGYSGGCNINWASVNAFGVVTFIGKQPGATETDICNGLKAGHGLVANVHNGGHWVLLTGCRGGGVFDVNDPGYSTTTYKKSDIVDLAVYH
jgi:hypothetical protein